MYSRAITGTTRSITWEIRRRPPKMVAKQVIPRNAAAYTGGIPKASFRAPTTDSVWTEQVQGPRVKQATDRSRAPRFQPRAFFITKDLSHMYSSMDLEYFTRNRWPRMISQALVDMPRQPDTHIQNTAPGPPDTMAVATPPMFPTPMVLAMAVQAAAKPETVPWPSPFWNILPKVFRKWNPQWRKL